MTEPVQIGGATRAGTHSCGTCGYERDVLTPELPPCPRCGGTEWVSVSADAAGHSASSGPSHGRDGRL
jgi:rubredoxin